jgi:hypothetical protein
MLTTTPSEVLRGLTATGVLLSASVHLQIWAQGMRTVPVVGEAFMANAIGGLVIGLLVLTWRRNPLPLLAALGFGLATLGAYVTSITVGLFGVKEEPGGAVQTLAAAAEIAAVVFAVAALVVEERDRKRHPEPPREHALALAGLSLRRPVR